MNVHFWKRQIEQCCHNKRRLIFNLTVWNNNFVIFQLRLARWTVAVWRAIFALFNHINQSRSMNPWLQLVIYSKIRAIDRTAPFIVYFHIKTPTRWNLKWKVCHSCSSCYQFFWKIESSYEFRGSCPRYISQLYFDDNSAYSVVVGRVS